MATGVAQKKPVELTSAYNVRDLGGYATQYGTVTSGRLLRADCFVPLADEDRDRLIQQGVNTVIDLRSEEECLQNPCAFAAHPLVHYCHLPLFAGDKAAGENPAGNLPKGFTMGQMYVYMLEGCAAGLQEVFDCIAEAATRPGKLLFHCSAGKDRTGVVAALLLSLTGVEDEVVVADYALTETLLAPVKDMLRKNSGLPALMDDAAEELLGAKPASMETLLAHLHSRYNTAWEYLNKIGLRDEQLEDIATMMTERTAAG